MRHAAVHVVSPELFALYRDVELEAQIGRPAHLQGDKLAAQFRADDAGSVRSLDDYLRREERVFEQLRGEVYDRVGGEDRRALNRSTPVRR